MMHVKDGVGMLQVLLGDVQSQYLTSLILSAGDVAKIRLGFLEDLANCSEVAAAN
jgi:hypothetical protein